MSKCGGLKIPEGDSKVPEQDIEISTLDYFEKCNVQIFLESNKMLKISPITKYSDNSIKSTVFMPFQQY